MAKAPWARLTKPIRPMVTESPTETMNSTVPADRPPSKMLAKLLAKSTGGLVTVKRTELRTADSEQKFLRYPPPRSSPDRSRQSRSFRNLGVRPLFLGSAVAD